MGQSLEELQAEFLAKGGSVTTVPIGATGLDNMGLAPLTFTNVDADRKKKAKESRLKAQTYSREDDLALVAVLHSLKDSARSNVELYRAMTCTNDRLQRLLRDYLKDDDTVDRFRAMSREDRIELGNKHLLAAVKAEIAKGTKGVHVIGSACGVSGQRVSQLAKRYGLTIERGDPTIKLAGSIQVAISQLERWVDYLAKNKHEEVEREIRTTLKRGSNDAT